ncbi:hypothetical protein PanWU01x14_103310 [Parasponia andersonii]|uniref:Uncharacterized protein n=1 Tax=Parasponia andersonii TaxID=3476 RepID=A0A2P5D242_PARAD|nr:hypothetical protein PanWU01x14_103310 [Parasponia andersonii]
MGTGRSGRVLRTWCTCARKAGAPPRHDWAWRVECGRHSATLRTAQADVLNVASSISFGHFSYYPAQPQARWHLLVI